MKPLDLLDTAALLLRSRNGRPTDANLRRSQSTIYYALFHCLARECADTLLGGGSSSRSENAWCQAYRALEHDKTKGACKKTEMIEKFPDGVIDFAYAFVSFQDKRKKADYDPSIRLTKSEVMSDLEQARQIVAAFKAVPLRHRRAFCVYVLFKMRP